MTKLPTCASPERGPGAARRSGGRFSPGARQVRSGSRIAVAILALLGYCAGCRTPPERFQPKRLIDLLPVEHRRSSAIIDGIVLPTLPPWRPEQEFDLDDIPPDPILLFSAGIHPSAGTIAARFTITLQPASGPPQPLFDDHFRTPGWREGRIDLAGRDLKGGRLIFSRHVSGDVSKLVQAVWGNPILIAADPPRRPSVVLVSLDTLRADFVGPYGRKNASTDALGRLAREGALFEHAHSPSTWTVPSHASLLFGSMIPVGSEMTAPPVLGFDWQGPERLLSEILRDGGYRTAAFTGGGFLDWPFGFRRGFDTYYAYQQPQGPGRCHPARFVGPAVFDGADQWLRANRNDPFFLFLHTYDVHDRCEFIPPEAELLGVWPKLSAVRQQELLEYYDRLIQRTDERLRALLATLDELGLTESTLVVVTSDHGEGFHEHGISGHGCDLRPYEELSRVPLLMRYPDRVPAGIRIETTVSLTDVAPTILALVGVQAPASMQGAVLPGIGLTPSAPEARPVYVQCGDALAIHAAGLKLITSREGRYPDEIYSLAQDPAEHHPLKSDPGHSALGQMATHFWRSAATVATRSATEPPLDETTKERLRALGYQ